MQLSEYPTYLIEAFIPRYNPLPDEPQYDRAFLLME